MMKKTLRRQAGLDWRRRDRWAGRATVNAVCAMACAQTLIQLGLDSSRPASRDAEGLKAGIALQASVLRAWLDLADTDEDAYLRRIALWLAADDASPQTDPKHLLECARSFHWFCSRFRTAVVRQNRPHPRSGDFGVRQF